MRRHLSVRAACAAVAAVLLAGCAGRDAAAPAPPAVIPSPTPSPTADLLIPGAPVPPPPVKPFDVTDRNFGVHSYSTKPRVPTGALRVSVPWNALQPSRGRFTWASLDATIDQAESWGYSDVLFFVCGTPRWAGTPVKGRDTGVFGPGSAQPVADLASYADFVEALARRYRGRISAYEPWNEPSSPQFFTGTPAQMARMTRVAERAIGTGDPDAQVLSASVQTHDAESYRDFTLPYLRQLAVLQWPVAAVAAHFYPSADGTPADRVAQITRLQRDLRFLDAPGRLAIWDTEVNYEVGLPGGGPDGRITGRRAAGWAARTYLDSWRTGLRRTYWYMWNDRYYSFPGIQLRIGDPATRALNVLGNWVIGKRFTGCSTPGRTVVCRFTAGARGFLIAWADRGTGSVAFRGRRQICPVTGSPCRERSGRVLVDEVPVRIG